MKVRNRKQKKPSISRYQNDLSLVTQDGLNLQYVINQTPELCLAGIKQNPHALQRVKEKTPELCLLALRGSGSTLRYFPQELRTLEMCLLSVRKNGLNLQYVINQTPELCLEAVRQNGNSIRFVNRATYELQLEAVKQDGNALSWIMHMSINQDWQTDELIDAAINQKLRENCKDAGMLLCIIKPKFHTFERCLRIVELDTRAIKYVKDPLTTDKLKQFLAI